MNDLLIVASIALCFVIWVTISTVVWFLKYLTNKRILEKLTELEEEMNEIKKMDRYFGDDAERIINELNSRVSKKGDVKC